MIADQFRAFREIAQDRANRAKGARQKTPLLLTVGVGLAVGVEMNETTGVGVIESPRRHARDQVAIVDKAVIDAAEFDFDIIAEIVQADARLAEGVEAIDREQCVRIVRAGPACQGGERAAEAVAVIHKVRRVPAPAFFNNLRMLSAQLSRSEFAKPEWTLPTSGARSKNQRNALGAARASALTALKRVVAGSKLMAWRYR